MRKSKIRETISTAKDFAKAFGSIFMENVVKGFCIMSGGIVLGTAVYARAKHRHLEWADDE